MSRQHTVLVVDDEPDVVQSIKDLLHLEFRVFGATTARQGIEILAHEQVHVIMTDQCMPEMTGVEFLLHVRAEHPDAVRLLITGYAEIRTVIEAINLGHIYRYIAKPWDSAELLSIVRESVDRYELRAQRNRLLSELQGKNEDLVVMNTQLRQSGELKEAFIRVASHELRTPLTSLLCLITLALRQPELVPPPLAGWLGRIDRAGQKLRHIVAQLTEKLRTDQFEQSLLRQPIGLAELLREAEDEVRPFVEIRQQSLKLDLGPDLGSVAVDAVKIRDALNNLLMNAIRFTPDEGRITLSARLLPGAGIEITIADTGIGIPADHLDLIFKPFFTDLDSLHHTSGQFEFGSRGIGLGLTVAREFVEMHGGTITVASEVGQGTKFTVTLPLVVTAPA